MDDIDETARLVLMDLPERSVIVFARNLRAVHPGVSTGDVGRLWAKYMGYDGRSDPTHNLETGERL